MTDSEKIVLTKLVEAWNAFLALPIEHPDDMTEFRHGIHALQEKVLAREARRVMADSG
jgi:hypothetical protein